MDSVPVEPHIWMFTLGEPKPDITARFAQITAMGELNWLIIPIPAQTMADLELPDGYFAVSSEDE